MSKHYKAKDVIRAIEEMQNCYNGWSDTYDKAQIIGVLEELPTIEVSEDCISREWVLKAIDAEDVGTPDEMWRPAREYVEMIKNAPSVVPDFKTFCGVPIEEAIDVLEKYTTEKSCDTCRHNKLEWFSEECDGCTKANSNYKPTTEQSSKVGEWRDHYYPYFEVAGIECSVCGKDVPYWQRHYEKPNYCPNCGAKMRLE